MSQRQVRERRKRPEICRPLSAFICTSTSVPGATVLIMETSLVLMDNNVASSVFTFCLFHAGQETIIRFPALLVLQHSLSYFSSPYQHCRVLRVFARKKKCFENRSSNVILNEHECAVHYFGSNTDKISHLKIQQLSSHTCKIQWAKLFKFINKVQCMIYWSHALCSYRPRNFNLSFAIFAHGLKWLML